MTPFLVQDKFYAGGTTQDKKTAMSGILVPCGKCPACYKRRVSQWSFRLYMEGKAATSSHFITLTYATEHVPITQKGYMSVCKRDVQLFFKRLRKLNDSRIKYFAAAEYGGKTDRPHYHIILFNAVLNTIQSAWNMGAVHYGLVEGASIGYTLKYMSKCSRIPKHENDDRVKEFGLMSKGLGEHYVTDAMKKWHHADKNNRMYCNLMDGKKIGMPRYYKQKIYSDEERKIIGWHTRKKQLEKQEIARQAGGEQYEANKASSIKAAFDRMAVKARSIQNNKI